MIDPSRKEPGVPPDAEQQAVTIVSADSFNHDLVQPAGALSPLDVIRLSGGNLTHRLQVAFVGLPIAGSNPTPCDVRRGEKDT